MSKTVLIVFALAALTLSACSGSSNSEELRRLAGTNAPQPAAMQQPEATPNLPPTQAPTQAPTETPDFGDAQPALMDPPTPAVIVVTPQVERVQPVCNELTPAPTIALDATDVAAGVVLRGQWQMCVYQTAVAAGMVQP